MLKILFSRQKNVVYEVIKLPSMKFSRQQMR